MVCPFSVFSPADPKFLMGQCCEIFCFWFFHESVSPPAPEYSIRTISNFFQKFAEIFTSHGALPVSMTPAANLPPASMAHIFSIFHFHGPNVKIRGLEETGPCRKPEVKNFVALSL
jgi:hypothetical protein